MYKIFYIICFVTFLSACDSNGFKPKTADSFNNVENPVAALKEAYKDFAVLKINQPTLTTIYYDSCLAEGLTKKIEAGTKPVEFNIINLNYLNQFIEGAKFDSRELKWDFLNSGNFNQLIPLKELKDSTKAAVALNHWQQIKSNRYTFVLQEQTKILPRTGYENYVLGGAFHGYAILYDIVAHKVICYFNYRINNSSNSIEDYSDKGPDLYENMMAELRQEMHKRMTGLISEKTGIDSSRVKLGLGYELHN